MPESKNDKFIEEVKTLLSGNISDQNTLDYLAFKIGRLHEQYLDQFFTNLGNAGRGYLMTPEELGEALGMKED